MWDVNEFKQKLNNKIYSKNYMIIDPKQTARE